MGWGWKLVCAILYMLPWTDVTEKTVFLIERFPTFAWAEHFTEPFEHWFYIHEWAPLIIFFGTYLGIVRNKKISHVARYHVMMVRCLRWMFVFSGGGGATLLRFSTAFPQPLPPSQQQQQPQQQTPHTPNRASCSTSSP
jgi:hypothetical protein